MEAVGLAISVISLAGLFKDCIDLFSMITDANALEKDFTILSVRLDIEKALLLQWAEQVKLVHPECDSRLRTLSTRRTVTRILEAINNLLSDGSKLEHRYGMQRVNIYHHERFQILSAHRLQHFLSKFSKLSLSNHQSVETVNQSPQSQGPSSPEAHVNADPGSQKQKATLKEKFCWAIRDKEKFGSLIRDLSGLVRGLDLIVQRPQLAQWRLDSLELLKQDVQHVGLISRLELLMDAAKNNDQPDTFTDMIQEQIDKQCQQRILDGLWYRMLDLRRNSVSDSHPGTFDWALSPPTDDVEWDDLSQWLQSGSGIYWIHGKPGSGKSTLMKYLYDNSATRSLLSEWAADEHVLVPHFFFWHLGTPEQKTQHGLYRGLLYHIFQDKPSLIQDILPEMWREAHNDSGLAAEAPTGTGAMKLDCPTEEEMMHGLLRLKSHRQLVPFCFFIDGLDEYSGDTFRLVEFLKKLVSTRIKAVVSSRPIPSCFQAFSRGPQLRLQDLTRNDIKTYVHNTIVLHPHTETLIEMDSTIVNKIQDELTTKASGVFLWVVLACRSLIRGFAAYDTPEELQQRLKELPPELNDLFRLILQRSDARYREQAAKLLSLCYYSTSLNTESGYQHKPLFTLGLALADADNLDITKPLQHKKMPQEERVRQCKSLEARLRSRSCGLLEIRLGDFGQCFCQSHLFRVLGRSDCQIVDSTVEFIHRTMYEFLKTSGIWDHEYLQIRDGRFYPAAILWRVNAHLMLASISKMQDYPNDAHDTAAFDDFIGSLNHLQELDAEPQNIYTALRVQVLLGTLLETAKILNLIISTKEVERPWREKPWLKRLTGYLTMHFRTSKNGFPDLVAKLACELGMETTCQHIDVSSYGDQSSPLLYHVIEKPLLQILFARGNDWPLCCPIIENLVVRGCDVNEAFVEYFCCETTPWIHWLGQPPSDCYETALNNIWLAQEFLKAGADVAGAVDRFQMPITTLIGRRVLADSREENNVDDKDEALKVSYSCFDGDLMREESLQSSYERVRKLLMDRARQYEEKVGVESVPQVPSGGVCDEERGLKRRYEDALEFEENKYSSGTWDIRFKRQMRFC